MTMAERRHIKQIVKDIAKKAHKVYNEKLVWNVMGRELIDPLKERYTYSEVLRQVEYNDAIEFLAPIAGAPNTEHWWTAKHLQAIDV